MHQSRVFMTEMQTALMEKTVPWGVIESRFMLGSDTDENRTNAGAFARLREKEILENKPISKGGQYKEVNREFLTMKGIETLQKSVPTNSPLTLIDTKKKLSVRNGKSADDLARITRMSDAQIFMTSAGAETIYTSITQYNIDPFIFGRPYISNSKVDNMTYTDAAMQGMIDYLTAREKAGDKCPLLSKYLPMAIYIPSIALPTSRVMTQDSKTKLRSFNNAVGLLIDTRNQNAYVVFKFLDRTKLTWQAKAYQAWLLRSSQVIRDLGIINVSRDYCLSDAIILCETQGEIYQKAKLCEKMSVPFNRIYPILMKPTGASILSALLNEGIDTYESSLVCEAEEKVPGIKKRSAPTRMFSLEYDRIPVYVGTQIDYRRLCDLTLIVKEQKTIIPYVVCYSNQSHFYRDIVKIPEERIIEIEEE